MDNLEQPVIQRFGLMAENFGRSVSLSSGLDSGVSGGTSGNLS